MALIIGEQKRGDLFGGLGEYNIVLRARKFTSTITTLQPMNSRLLNTTALCESNRRMSASWRVLDHLDAVKPNNLPRSFQLCSRYDKFHLDDRPKEEG